MNVGYMTNAWGVCAGHPVGVPSIKDLFYISTGSNEEAMQTIAEAGFPKIEMFDGNLYPYRDNRNKFAELLAKYGLRLTAVYTAANFIYDEILEEEFFKMKKAIDLAKMFGAEYINVGGGALRFDGPKKSDFDKLAAGLNRFNRLSGDNGLIASFHHHLDSLVQTEAEIDRIMGKTDINLCVDTAHIYAAGGNPVRVTKKYLDRICYMHIKDYKNDFEPLGMGNIDFDALFDVLAPNLPKVQLTIEANDIKMDLSELARHNYQLLESQLRRVGHLI